MTENIAKKTLMKIEKEQTKLEALTAKRDEFVSNHQMKLSEMNGDIARQKKLIAGLREQEKREKLDTIATLAEKNGVSINELLSAALNGDFYSIQEKLEGKKSSSSMNFENVNDELKKYDDNEIV